MGKFKGKYKGSTSSSNFDGKLPDILVSCLYPTLPLNILSRDQGVVTMPLTT